MFYKKVISKAKNEFNCSVRAVVINNVRVTKKARELVVKEDNTFGEIWM